MDIACKESVVSWNAIELEMCGKFLCETKSTRENPVKKMKSTQSFWEVGTGSSVNNAIVYLRVV
jgi:hypothetical protein